MAGVNIANSGLLYIKYEKEILETLNQEALSYSEPKSKPWKGKNIEGRVHVMRSDAMGFTEDGGSFRTPKRQRYVSYEIYRRFFQAIIRISGGAMAAARRDPAVARDVVESETRGMLDGIKKFMNGVYFLDGTGRIAKVINNEASGATAIEVDDARLIWEGAEYDVVDSTGATNRGRITVVSVAQALDSSGYGVVTIEANSIDMAANDYLIWPDTYVDALGGRAITGLDTLVDDSATTFQAVDVSAYPRYSSLVLSATADRPITPALLRQFLAGLYQKTGRKPKDLAVYASPWQAKEFEEMYEGELRLGPNDKVVGLDVVTFTSALGRVKLKSDSDCPRSKLFAADRSQLTRYTQKPLGWRLQGGALFLRSDVSNEYTATMDEICELAIADRRTSGKIENLSSDANIAY